MPPSLTFDVLEATSTPELIHNLPQYLSTLKRVGWFELPSVLGLTLKPANTLGWGDGTGCGWVTQKGYMQASDRQGGSAPGGNGSGGKRPEQRRGEGAGSGPGGGDPPRPPAPPPPPTGPPADLNELDDEETWEWALKLRALLFEFDPVMFIRFLCNGKEPRRSWKQSRAINERGPIPWEVNQKVTDHVRNAWVSPSAGQTSNRYSSSKSSAPFARHLFLGEHEFGPHFVRSQFWLALLHAAHCTITDQSDWSSETRGDNYYGLGPRPRRPRDGSHKRRRD